MKAVWNVLGVGMGVSAQQCEWPGVVENCSLTSYSITAAQCVELSLSNVSNWMGDHQRKHCAQLPGEARKLEEY